MTHTQKYCHVNQRAIFQQVYCFKE